MSGRQELTADEYARVLARMRADWQARAVPLEPGQPLVLVVVTGLETDPRTATAVAHVTRDWYGDGRDHFLHVDYRDAVRYHPRPADRGLLRAERDAMEILARLVEKEWLDPATARYGVALYLHMSSVEPPAIVDVAAVLRAAAQLSGGWHTVLLHVAAPVVPMAELRVHQHLLWAVPFWALSADEFVLVDGRRQPPAWQRVDVRMGGRAEDWRTPVENARRLICRILCHRLSDDQMPEVHRMAVARTPITALSASEEEEEEEEESTADTD